MDPEDLWVFFVTSLWIWKVTAPNIDQNFSLLSLREDSCLYVPVLSTNEI